MPKSRRVFLGLVGTTALTLMLPALAAPTNLTTQDAETIKARVFEAVLVPHTEESVDRETPDVRLHFKTSDWKEGNRAFRIVRPWNMASLVNRLSDWDTYGYMRRKDVTQEGPLSPRLQERVWKILELTYPSVRKRKPKKIDQHQTISCGPIYTNGYDEAIVEAFSSWHFDDRTLGDNGGGSASGYIFHLKRRGGTWKVQTRKNTMAAG